MQDQVDIAKESLITEPAMIRAIKTIGVGKRGSEDCDAHLVEDLIAEIKAQVIDPAQLGAFLGALWIKGATTEELKLNTAFPEPILNSSKQTAEFVLREYRNADLKATAAALLTEILNKRILTAEQMETLGDFLFSTDFPEAAKGLVASAIRVRYTEPQEYFGLAKAIEKTYNPSFKNKNLSTQKGLIQLADPFDGVDRSDNISPIIANHFVKQNYKVLQMAGPSSGPKFGMNAQMLTRELDLPSLMNTETLNQGPFGAVLNQQELSPALSSWTDLRQRIIKRPFLATLERFLNPLKAEYFFVSAFHATFTDKMIDIAELMGFQKIAVIFKSVEGHLGLSLGRTTEVQISKFQPNGTYIRQELKYIPEDFNLAKIADPKDLQPDLVANKTKILAFVNNGSSGDSYFDQRAKYSLLVYDDLMKRLN